MTVAETTKSSCQIIDEAECRQITKLSRPQRYKMERAGKFPQRVRLTDDSARHGWLLGEIEDWIRQRANKRPAQGAA